LQRKPEDDVVDSEGTKKARKSVDDVEPVDVNEKQMECDEAAEDQKEIQKENSKPDDHPNKISSSGDHDVVAEVHASH
jgi:hypothetical protein